MAKARRVRELVVKRETRRDRGHGFTPWRVPSHNYAEFEWASVLWQRRMASIQPTHDET